MSWPSPDAPVRVSSVGGWGGWQLPRQLILHDAAPLALLHTKEQLLTSRSINIAATKCKTSLTFKQQVLKVP